MKVFIDSADINDIREAASWGVLSGCTTNPTLMQRAGASYQKSIKEICSVVKGPVSAEVLSEEPKEMVKQAVKLSKIHKNVNIKVPIGAEGLKVIKALSGKGIKTNCTLVFTANQALLAAAAGATFASPFVGRLDDINENGMKAAWEIIGVLKNSDYKTKVIVASVRNTQHVVQAALLGADIATIPFKVLKEMMLHPLTDKGKRLFREDAKKAGLRI